MKVPEYPNGYEAYDDARFAQFALRFFTDMQVAGRLPLFGDSASDTGISDDGKIFDRGTLSAAFQFYRFSTKKEIRDAALQTASVMFRDMPSDFVYNANDLFKVFGIEDFTDKAKQIKDLSSGNVSTFLFDYGTLILRSGEKGNERAALMRFGPSLNHSQADELGLAFYARGREFSFDPGYFNTHLRFGFTTTTVAHNVLVVNRSNQLRRPSPGGDLQSWTDGEVLRSAAVNNPQAYSYHNVTEYKRRIALIDISHEESYIIDNFWAGGGKEYDYSLHGITKGKLTILPGSAARLKETRKGSVLSAEIDYSSEMDLNGRVNSYADKPFYFAPPGGGYGFLSNPSFYTVNGPVMMQWSSTDNTDHQMYVWQFAPPASELITAQSPKPRPPIDLTYALMHAEAQPSETVLFTSVIHTTGGDSKIAEVKQLFPRKNSGSVMALRLKPGSGTTSKEHTHFYAAADNITGPMKFDGGFSFSGEEGFLATDASGQVVSASLTGTGYIKKDNFKLTVSPLFKRPLEVLEIKNQPLRILVNASYDLTKQLEGSIIRIVRPLMARPFVIRVNKSTSAGENSWLTMDASTNIHSVGVVQSYDPDTNSIITDAPFPHTRPYVYTYSETTGLGAQKEENVQYDYNEGYNGFWLVVNENAHKSAVIKTIDKKRTRIIFENDGRSDFSPGEIFEIRLLAPGDTFDVPAWSQAKLQDNGAWQLKGPARMKITD
jgi:hypothetical protein